MEKKVRDPLIYHAICNPPGEKTHLTTFYDTTQLDKLQNVMSGTPVKILHLHKNYPNSGTVLHGKVNPKTGALHTFFYFNDTPAGKLAQKLTGELPGISSDKRMNEVSMGFEVAFNAKNIPKKNKLNEISLCWEGDRKGTVILHKVPLSQIAKKIKENKGGKFPPSLKTDFKIGPY